MRLNGPIHQFRTVLSSIAKGLIDTPESHWPNVKRDCQDPVPDSSLVDLDSYMNCITQKSGETGPKTSKISASFDQEGGSRGQNQKTNVTSIRLARRKDIYEKRKLVSDCAVFFALLGINTLYAQKLTHFQRLDNLLADERTVTGAEISAVSEIKASVQKSATLYTHSNILVMMIMENELSAAGFYSKNSVHSHGMKTLILLSTVVLLAFVAAFHVLEVQLFMNDNSAEDWRIAMNWRRIVQISVEMTICAVCPVPGDFCFSWTTIHADGETVTTTNVPVDVLLSIPMFLRLYLICRVMLLHSRLFTDASSRSIGALNRVNFNARFVLKTLMTLCPGTVLLVFTASLWVINGWILRLCERYHSGDPPGNIQALKHKNYLNSLWLIAITFLSVGYGDIVPNTYCGRTVAVITGIMGAGTASMVVAVIARKLELTRAEKHVHNFMMDTQLAKRLKHAAANVLRETWLIYKNRRLVEKIEPSRIRMHQRKFLMAIHELRKVKRDQRKLAENSMTIGDAVKSSSSTYELVLDMHSCQANVDNRLSSMEQQLQLLRTDIQQLNTLLQKVEKSGQKRLFNF